MSDKYAAYLELLATRDQAMHTLALLAIGVVLAWYALRLITPRYRWTIQRIYLAGGLILFVVTVVLVSTIPVQP